MIYFEIGEGPKKLIKFAYNKLVYLTNVPDHMRLKLNLQVITSNF